jgi:hypothetical protein
MGTHFTRHFSSIQQMNYHFRHALTMMGIMREAVERKDVVAKSQILCLGASTDPVCRDA